MRFEKQMWNGDSIFLQEVTLLITVRCRNVYTLSILFTEGENGAGQGPLPLTEQMLTQAHHIYFKVNEHYQIRNKTLHHGNSCIHSTGAHMNHEQCRTKHTLE